MSAIPLGFIVLFVWLQSVLSPQYVSMLLV